MAKPKPHQILYLAGVESIIRLLHWRVGGLLYSSGSHLHIDTPSTLYTRGWNSNLTYLLNALRTTPKKEWTLWPCYETSFLKSIHIHWQTCSFYEIFSAFKKKTHNHPSKNPANVIRLLSLEYLDLSSQRLKWEIFSIQPVTFVFYATAAAAVASWKNSSSSFLSTLLIVQLSTICLDPIEITKLKFPTRSGGPKGKLLLRKNFRRIRRKEADVTLTYLINVPVWLPNFQKKPWSMFGEYFWPVKMISVD